MFDIIEREIAGKTYTFYSEKYLKEQIENSFRAGIMSGIQKEFHAVEPVNLKQVTDLLEQFMGLVNDHYEREFSKGHVWQVAGEKLPFKEEN